MQSWRSSHHSTARHAPFSSQSQPASPCLILHLAFCTTSPHHRNASPRPALDRNISRRTIPTIHISPSTSSRPSLPQPITASKIIFASIDRKTTSRPQVPTAARTPYSCTGVLQLHSTLQLQQCQLPSHRLLHPPEHLHMYVHMQCRDLDCQGQRGVPPCPRLPRLSLLPSSLRFDMLWNLDPCPSSTTES